MSSLLLPLTLLIAAYFGTILAEGRTIRGFGLPSGAEWLVLGVVLGPHVLGAFDASTIRDFQPFVIVGLGWTALTIGVDYGYVGERRIAWRGHAFGLALPAISIAAVACAVYWFAQNRLGLGSLEAATLALGLSLVSSETTRHAVRWVTERYGANGPLSRTLADISDADDALPLLGLAVLFALATEPTLNVEVPIALRLVLPLGLGAVLGLIAAGLLAKSLAFGESWTVVIGMALLGIGMSDRLGSASLTVLFVAGAVLSLVSHRHGELRKMLAPTERPVTLPLLLLGGATLDLRGLSASALELLGIVIAMRIAVKVISGWFLALFIPGARRASTATGAALLASGTVTMSIGLYGYLRLSAPLGEWMLIAASLVTVVGEFIGPLALRRALVRAGEIEQLSRESASPERASEAAP